MTDLTKASDNELLTELRKRGMYALTILSHEDVREAAFNAEIAATDEAIAAACEFVYDTWDAGADLYVAIDAALSELEPVEETVDA